MMMANPSACVPVAMPDSGTTTPDMPVQVHTMTPPREYEDLIYRAVCQCAAIERQDMINDPVNYWIGMWGKLILLVAIKRQGFKQQVEPEENTNIMDWANILLVVSDRTPVKMKEYLSVHRCHHWVDRRIKLFKDCLPSYNKCGSILDKLARHYSKQLTNLIELKMPYARHLHWENLHEPAGSSDEGWIPNLGTANPQLTLACLPVGKFRSQSSLLATSFCSFAKVNRPSFKNYSTGCGSSTGSTPTSVSTFKGKRKVDTQTGSGELRSRKRAGMEMETSVDASRQLAFNIANNEGKPNVCLKIYSADTNTNQEYVPHYHPVFEHGSTTSQSCSRKRALDSNENEVHQHQKQVKIGDLYSRAEEIQRDRLLVIFNQFKTGKMSSWMRHMSWILSKTENSNSLECEYSLGNIEEKIKNFEIADFKTLINAFRCLVGLCLIRINGRKINPDIVKLQQGLKIAAECTGIYPYKEGNTWRGL